MSPVKGVEQALLSAGASWVLWLLAALSVASLCVFVERLLYLRGRGGDLPTLARSLGAALGRGERALAMAELERNGSVAASIAAAGMELAERGPQAAENAMLSATTLERARLERRLAFLSTLGNNAPFVGLFGTVVGIVHAFAVLGRGGQLGRLAATGNQALMAAIAEALVTTAVGILVALPAVAANNYLSRRVTRLLSDSEALSYLVLAYLCDRSVPPGPSPTEVEGDDAPSELATAGA